MLLWLTGNPRTELRRSALKHQGGSMLTRCSSGCLLKLMSQMHCIYTPKSLPYLIPHLVILHFFVYHSRESVLKFLTVTDSVSVWTTQGHTDHWQKKRRKKIDGPRTHSGPLFRLTWERVQANNLEVLVSLFSHLYTIQWIHSKFLPCTRYT